MALPRVSLPSYSLKLPGQKKTVKYRAYVNSEEKLLLMAMESGDPKGIVEATKNVVASCLLTPSIHVDDLAPFDLDLLFLNIRAKSVGENADIRFQHAACPAHPETGCTHDLSIDLTKIDVTFPPDHVRKFLVTSSIGIEMRYPSISILEKLRLDDEELSDVEKNERVAIACIGLIWEGENVFPADEQPDDELVRFYGSLPISAKEKIVDFFRTMPSIRYEKTICCGRCHANVVFTATGLGDFFGLASAETR